MDDYTRIETYLSGIANGTPVPEPYTRIEKLLYDIAQNGGGLPSGSSDGDIPAWDATNSEWGVLSKGSITASDTGYVTGGDVYAAIGDIESALADLIGDEGDVE